MQLYRRQLRCIGYAMRGGVVALSPRCRKCEVRGEVGWCDIRRTGCAAVWARTLAERGGKIAGQFSLARQFATLSGEWRNPPDRRLTCSAILNVAQLRSGPSLRHSWRGTGRYVSCAAQTVSERCLACHETMKRLRAALRCLRVGRCVWQTLLRVHGAVVVAEEVWVWRFGMRTSGLPAAFDYPP